MKKPIIALDRDGVINHDSADYIRSPEQWQAIDGSLDAIARLCQSDHRVFVLTNQSGVGRGLFDIATLNAIHTKMQQEVKHHGGSIERIFYCPHTPDDHCDCRKPATGLLQQLLDYTSCCASDIIFVGDSLRDLQAADAMGCKTSVLVKTGNGERVLAEHSADPAVTNAKVFADLASFVDAFLPTGTLP